MSCFRRVSRLLPLLMMAFPPFVLAASPGPETTATLDSRRIEEITPMLPERPTGPGRPITDREAWETLGRNPAYAEKVAQVQTLLGKPLPDQPDDLYLEYSRNGNRTRWQAVAAARRERLTPLVIAECVENKGRFLPAIEDLMTTLCAERTWVMPAHDRTLSNFRGTQITIDLASSAVGWNFATADFLLGERLRPEVRKQIRENVNRRLFVPFRRMLHGEQDADFWLHGTNNWNPVCLAGVTGAALILLDSRQERAEVVAAAEHLTKNFLAGFTSDGYCSEGLGYWNYGFGRYTILSELIRGATGGQVDLLARPASRMPALFPAGIEIMNGVSPAFADCSVRATPSPAIMWILNHRFGLGLEKYAETPWRYTFSALGDALVCAFPPPDSAPAAGGGPVPERHALRTWFDKAGVLIGRPSPGSSCRIGVALKGGNNAEHHNHNDLGSYVVLAGSSALLLDPGAEVYTARTFSSKRYDSKLLNSFGHPVPVIGGQLQRAGRKSEARILETAFSDTSDTLRMDILSAYRVPELTRLERAFVYDRSGQGALTVTDQVEFKTPQTYGTALITLGKHKQLDEKTLLITDGKEQLRVTIDTGGRAFTLKPERIEEEAPVKPTRLGIDLTEPITSATVQLTIVPEAVASGTASKK